MRRPWVARGLTTGAGSLCSGRSLHRIRRSASALQRLRCSPQVQRAFRHYAPSGRADTALPHDWVRRSTKQLDILGAIAGNLLSAPGAR